MSKTERLIKVIKKKVYLGDRTSKPQPSRDNLE